MGRKGSGVSVYETGIRLRISAGGFSVSEVLRIQGKVATPTKSNLRYAERLSDEIRRHMLNGTYRHSDYFESATTGQPDSVGEALDRWIRTQIGIAPSTRRGYLSAIKFWKEQIGDKPLTGLRRSDVLTALASRETWTGKTRKNKVGPLSMALQLAVHDGLLTSNPSANLGVFKHQRPEPDPFTPEERDAILAHFRYNTPEQLWNYFACQFWTGMRTNEGLGLCWGEVELDARRVTVLRGLVDGKMTDRTKTARSRVIDLNDEAHAALVRQAKFSRMAGGRVFTEPIENKPWESDRPPRRIWQRALLKLGIRYRDPYHTRHTYATTLIMAGLKSRYVAAQLGHSVNMLETRYSKWLDGEDNAREQGKLAAYIKNKEKTDEGTGR